MNMMLRAYLITIMLREYSYFEFE